MILVLTFPTLPLHMPTLYHTTPPTHISTGFYMCHQSGPISMLLIVSLRWLFTVYIPNHVRIIPCIHAVGFLLCFHSCTSSSACGQCSFSQVPHSCPGSVHCCQQRSPLHLILPQCISLCIECSSGSAPFTLHQFLEIITIHVKFLQFIIVRGDVAKLGH